jgi:hypothetical protein
MTLTKSQRLKWNTDVVGWLSAELNFEVVTHNEFHLSLMHPKRGRLDYWPTTQKAIWVKENGKTFHIEDIEQYLLKHFKIIQNQK